MKQTDMTTKINDIKFRLYRSLVFFLVFSGFLWVYFHRLSPAVTALDMQKHFQVGGTLLGLLASAYFYPYVIMQLPVGVLLDRWGPRYVISIFFSFAGIGSLIVGLSDSVVTAFIGRTLVGFGCAALFVGSFKLASQWFNSKQMVVAGGILLSFGGVGVLAAGSPLAAINQALGWQYTMILIGIVSIVLAFLVYILVRDWPSELGWKNPSLQEEDIYYRSEEKDVTGDKKVPLFRSLKIIVSCIHFWPLALWFAFSHGVVFAFTGMWSVPYLQQVHNLTLSQASFYQNMLGVALIIGSPLLSSLSNKIGKKNVLVFISIFPCVVFVIFWLYPKQVNLNLMYVLFFMSFLGTATAGAIIISLAKALVSQSLVGTVAGAVNSFVFILTGPMQTWMGHILEQGGRTAIGTYTVGAYKNMFFILLYNEPDCVFNGLLN